MTLKFIHSPEPFGDMETIIVNKRAFIEAVLELERRIQEHVVFMERVEKLAAALHPLVANQVSDNGVLQAKADLLGLFMSDQQWDLIFSEEALKRQSTRPETL